MRIFNKSILKRLIIPSTVLLLGVYGCGVTKSTTNTPTTPEKTIITYKIEPEKTAYQPNEDIKITATIVGPKKNEVGVIWGFKLSNGQLNSLPKSTDTTYEFKTGSSGSTIRVTGKPAQEITENGVPVIEGSVTYNIQTI